MAEILILVAAWCGNISATNVSQRTVYQCREKMLACIEPDRIEKPFVRDQRALECAKKIKL